MFFGCPSSEGSSPTPARIGVIAYSPMGSGMLTGAMTRNRAAALPESDWRKHDPQLSQNLELVERLETVAERRDTTPGRRRFRLDTPHPRGRRCDRRLPSARSGRPNPHRCQPRTQ
ncbi:MAG: aldo/keto reductase [Solirubrobacteraceae bacterium]